MCSWLKKHSCKPNFFPFCQEWKRLGIWGSKNDFSLLLILFQCQCLRSNKVPRKANPEVPLGVSPTVNTEGVA